MGEIEYECRMYQYITEEGKKDTNIFWMNILKWIGQPKKYGFTGLPPLLQASGYHYRGLIPTHIT